MNEVLKSQDVQPSQDQLVREAVHQKLSDATLGAVVIEFTPEEAEIAGAFDESAVDEIAAAEAIPEPPKRS